MRWPGRPSGSVSVTDNSTLEMCIHVMRYTDRRLYFYLFFCPRPYFILTALLKAPSWFWRKPLSNRTAMEERTSGGKEQRRRRRKWGARTGAGGLALWLLRRKRPWRHRPMSGRKDGARPFRHSRLYVTSSHGVIFN